MKQRVLTGLFFAILFIPGAILGGVYFFALGLIITYVSSYELMNMFSKKNEGIRIIKYIIPIFSTIFYVLLQGALRYDSSAFKFDLGKLVLIGDINKIFNSLGILLLFASLIILLIAIISLFLKNPGRSAINGIVSFIYGGVILSLALGLGNVSLTKEVRFAFPGITFCYVYLIVVLTDVFAYFIGSKLGKHKLCPLISPKKSIEGAIGGTLIASILGTIYVWVFNLFPIDYALGIGHIVLVYIFVFIFSALVSAVSQFGDLFASTLKREYEIKDYGNILPGHGGVLDRFDSLALAGSIFFVLVYIIKFVVALVL